MRKVLYGWPILILLLFSVLPIFAQIHISKENYEASKAEIKQLAAQKAYQKALIACDLLLKKLSADPIGNPQRIADIKHNQAALCKYMGSYSTAIQYARDAFQLYDNNKQYKDAAAELLLIAHWHYHSENLDSCLYLIDKYDQYASKIKMIWHEMHLEAILLQSMVYDRQLNQAEKLNTLLIAYDFIKTYGSELKSASVAKVYNNLGTYCLDIDANFEASIFFQHSLNLKAYKKGFEKNIFNSLLNLSLAHFKLKSYNKAKEYALKALIQLDQKANLDQNEQKQKKMMILNQLGSIYKKLNRKDSAEYYLKIVLKDTDDDHMTPIHFDAKRQLALIQLAQNKYDFGISLLNECQYYYKKDPVLYKDQISIILLDLSTHLQAENPSLSKAHIKAAFELIKQNNSIRPNLKSLIFRQLLKFEWEDVFIENDVYDAVVKNSCIFLKSYLFEKDKSEFLKHHVVITDHLLKKFIKMIALGHEKQELLFKCLVLIEIKKSLHTIQQKTSLEYKNSSIGNELYSKMSNYYATIDKEGKLNSIIELLSQIKTESKIMVEDDVEIPTFNVFKKFQSSIDKQVVFLIFHMLDDSGFQIQIGHDELQLKPIFIDQSKLENFNNWATNPDFCNVSKLSCIIDQFSNAHELYHQLKIPSNFKEIHISTDEQLNNLSFEALIHKPVKSIKIADQNFLVKSKDIAYFHTLHSIIKPEDPHKSIAKKLGVILNESKESSDLIYHLEELKFLEGKFEIEKINTAEQSKLHILDQMKDIEHIHFALHAYSDTSKVDEIYFILRNHPSDQSKLLAKDILQLNMKDKFIFLNSCQTATGYKLIHNKTRSLSNIFFTAGASACIAHNWNADDRATSELIQFFYDSLSVNNRAIHAISAAKRSFLMSNPEKYQHPYYWASMVLNGSKQSLIIAEKSIEKKWYFASLSVVLMLIILFLATKYKNFI